MFASFLQAGFECSSHKLRSGRRLDLIASTQHDKFVRDDYRQLVQHGIRTVREGLRWHLVENVAGTFDFSSVVPLIEAANEADIEVIWDLFHFGWPDHLDIFTCEWQESFGTFAAEFAKLWRCYSGKKALFVAPVNEISFFSWAGGDVGALNPFARNRGAELKRQLARGFLAAGQAIRAEVAKVTIIAPEPVIHIAGDPADPGDMAQAETFRVAMFEAWDMLCGRLDPQLGGYTGAFDVIGVNYYDRNQWRNYGSILQPGDAGYRPFHQILLEVWKRYRTPLLISETGSEGGARPQWFAYVATEARKATQHGVNLKGICLYPILNHRGWDDDRLCLNGLLGEVAADGHRALYAPLAAEMREQEQIRKGVTGEVMNKQAADRLESIDLICFSHLRWNFVFQRPQHLMSRFARNRRVFFVEEPIFSNEGPAALHVTVCPQSGVIVVTPRVPGEEANDSAATIRGLQTAFLRKERVERFVAWYYTPLALDYSPVLVADLIIYDCMDELSLFRGASPRILSAEEELLAVADMVFTGGTSLYEAKRDRHSHVYAFPSGVDIAHFIQARTIDPAPYDEDPSSLILGPKLGYAGVIDERLDLELIQMLADWRPEWQIMMVGPVVKIDAGTLPQRSNIHWLGLKDYKQLPRYFAGWHVGLLPFALNDATRYISPTKTPEYLAAGLQVVSTPIRDVVTPYGDLGMATIAHTRDEFLAACQGCIDRPMNADLRIKTDSFLAMQSWEDTWVAMNKLVMEGLTQRFFEAPQLESEESASKVGGTLYV